MNVGYANAGSFHRRRNQQRGHGACTDDIAARDFVGAADPAYMPGVVELHKLPLSCTEGLVPEMRGLVRLEGVEAHAMDELLGPDRDAGGLRGVDVLHGHDLDAGASVDPLCPAVVQTHAQQQSQHGTDGLASSASTLHHRVSAVSPCN